MLSIRISRRGMIQGCCLLLANGLFLSACGATAPSSTSAAATTASGSAAAATTAASAAANTSAAASAPAAATPTAAAVSAAATSSSPQVAGATNLTIWFHWGGKQGDAAQKVVDSYNSTQGQQDKIHVNIEVVNSAPDAYRTKMSAARLAGTSPDVYGTGLAISELVHDGVAAALPTEEQLYVKQNYVPGAVQRMTYQGKIWGYPTENNAGAFLYRQSFYKEMGLQPPQTTDDIRLHAKTLTKSAGGKTTRYGYVFWWDNTVPFFFAETIARFGGQMVTFDGDRPTKLNVTSPEAIDAMSWYRGMVDDGSTNVGQMSQFDAWQNGLASSGEGEPWLPLQNLEEAGKDDIFQDLGVVRLPAKSGVKPLAYVNGWELVGSSDSKHADERWSFLRWMMHKPAMPWSHFIVDFDGSLPAPTDYPTPIQGWSQAMMDGYITQTLPITQVHPLLLVLGKGDIDTVCAKAIQSIMLKKQTPAQAMQQIQPQLDAILKKNYP